MQLRKDQVEIMIQKGQEKGLTGKQVIDSLVRNGYEPEGVNVQAIKQSFQPAPTEQKQSFGGKVKETFQDFKGIGMDILTSSQKQGEKLQEISQDPNKNVFEKQLQNVGALASAGAGAIGAVTEGAVKMVLGQRAENKVKELVSQFGEQVVSNPQVQGVIKLYNSLPENVQDNIDAVGGIASLASEFVGGGVAQRGGKKVLQTGMNVAEDAISAVSRNVDEFANVSGDAVKTSKNSFIKALSPEIDDSVKTVLQKTNPTKFDEFVQTASRNAGDNTAPSVYEKVADSMSNATEQIANQTRSLSQQKNAIISKAKNGLSDFTKETGETILEINRTLKNSPVAKSFIERLKIVKNKIDADKAIDELQDILYRGKKDMTIPVGSIEERTLSSIIGKYNSKLKEGLPTSYANINKQIADRLSTLDDLNRALGEVVEGVPIRGAGLVKQFFSPAGTKAKQLFQFVKKNTGIDLAEDAVLAKYIGDAFGDAKVRSLLEGVPTSRGGVVDKVLDFTLEKTGANKALRETRRKGMLEKAKDYLPKE
jgi:hypothetical protein